MVQSTGTLHKLGGEYWNPAQATRIPSNRVLFQHCCYSIVAFEALLAAAALHHSEYRQELVVTACRTQTLF
jgi:hypothetical protein